MAPVLGPRIPLHFGWQSWVTFSTGPGCLVRDVWCQGVVVQAAWLELPGVQDVVVQAAWCQGVMVQAAWLELPGVRMWWSSLAPYKQ